MTDLIFKILFTTFSTFLFFVIGLSDGKHIGWCECFDMLEDDD